jgi:SAM-dependent methyltransferase
MLKSILFLIISFIATYTFAQRCQNPNVRLQRLNTIELNKDTAFIWVKNDLNFIQLQAYDTVADIGSFDGYYPSLYSVFTDSISFFLNDINAEGFLQFDSIQTLCTRIRGSNLTNSFQIVLGGEENTNLPTNLFSKVILRDVLYHFKNMDAMLMDIKKTLKSNGKLVLFEPLLIEDSMVENLCKGTMTKKQLLFLMTKNGFKLTREFAVKNDRFWLEFEMK